MTVTHAAASPAAKANQAPPRISRPRKQPHEQTTVAAAGSAIPPHGMSLDTKVDLLMQQMVELGRQNAALLEEVRDLRRENVRLRQELDAATGRHSHVPYAAPAVEEQPLPVSSNDPVVGERPLTPVGLTADIIMDHDSPEPQRDPKRVRPTVDPGQQHDA